MWLPGESSRYDDGELQAVHSPPSIRQPKADPASDELNWKDAFGVRAIPRVGAATIDVTGGVVSTVHV
jgi:hypothetical protein